MDEGLIIEGISFQGRCGVSLDERSTPQPLLADLEFICPAQGAIQTDRLSKTIDYAEVSSRVVAIGDMEECALIETLADRISRILLEEFPIKTLRIWLRKVKPPLDHVIGSVGVRLTYHRSQASCIERITSDNLSPFLLKFAQHIPRGQVLDLACGSGRHALHLANLGYEVVGLDRNAETLNTLAQTAREHHLSNLVIRALDLEKDSDDPPSLGENEYAGIIVFYYLYRPIIPSIIRALKFGGILIYETFHIDNHHQYNHPRRKEFCLEDNELLRLTSKMRILHYEEGQHQNQAEQNPVFTVRLVAQKI